MVDVLWSAGGFCCPGSAGFGCCAGAGSAARAEQKKFGCAVHPFVAFFSLMTVPVATPFASILPVNALIGCSAPTPCVQLIRNRIVSPWYVPPPGSISPCHLPP